jgi:cysteine-rich repeat protein
LSCKDCYECTQCRPDYTLDAKTGLCLEVCGDGKRYTAECDDGNNVDGDGCSKDCNAEVGFSCYGGSPSSKDSCTAVLPSTVSIESRGQTRLYGKVVLNVRLNYLPKALLASANDCKESCNTVLSVDIVSGFKGAKSISARYIPTTSFIFAIEIDFGKEPIGQFSVEVGVNQNLRNQYFSGVDISKKLTVEVNPAYLAKLERNPNGKQDRA